ncbi:MAG: hypothetical protein J0L61_09715, partial [Planctomycetes bacterium]|nr:hypothetical protein [Planctomycetota bacterium]
SSLGGEKVLSERLLNTSVEGVEGSAEGAALSGMPWQDGGEARCEVRGSVVIEPGGTDLAGLVQRLEGSPLVAGVTLGGVQRQASRPGASEFQATIRLVGFTTIDGAPVAEGGTP